MLNADRLNARQYCDTLKCFRVYPRKLDRFGRNLADGSKARKASNLVEFSAESLQRFQLTVLKMLIFSSGRPIVPSLIFTKLGIST